MVEVLVVCDTLLVASVDVTSRVAPDVSVAVKLWTIVEGRRSVSTVDVSAVRVTTSVSVEASKFVVVRTVGPGCEDVSTSVDAVRVLVDLEVAGTYVVRIT